MKQEKELVRYSVTLQVIKFGYNSSFIPKDIMISFILVIVNIFSKFSIHGEYTFFFLSGWIV